MVKYTKLNVVHHTQESGKTICSAPSFGKLVPDLATITNALSTHVSRPADGFYLHELVQEVTQQGAHQTVLQQSYGRSTALNKQYV